MCQRDVPRQDRQGPAKRAKVDLVLAVLAHLGALGEERPLRSPAGSSAGVALRALVPSFLSPPDSPDVVYEFFAPFAHVEGKYEWCRIRSPTHGVFDTFILIERTPIVVYVDTDAGAKYLAERYPEVTCVRAAPGSLRIEERDEGRTVQGVLTAREGPVRAAKMVFTAPVQKPRAVPYGGLGKPVWNSKRFTCWGVDLVLDAKVMGAIEFAEGYTTQLRGDVGVVTLGSFGRIAPL